MTESVELAIIGISILVAVGIMVYHPARGLGIPGFVIFLGIGLFLGNGTYFEFTYDDAELTDLLSQLALNVIIFVGGFNSSLDNIKKAYKEGLVLSTIGVFLTTFFLGYFTFLVTDLPLMTSLLFGAVVSSTDAAAVFSIIESKKLKLKHNTDTILEFESATNDPMALVLVIIFTSIVVSGGDTVAWGTYGLKFLTLLIIGVLIAVIIGWIFRTILTRVTFQELGLVPIFVLAAFLIATYGSDLLGGNILVASYILGVILGNAKFGGHGITKTFLNSLSWLAQAIMFLFLGLQLFPQELIKVFLVAILPSLFLIILGRPLAVLISYLPFRSAPRAKRLFIGAIGLKGATPIVFAFIPLLQGVPEGNTIFNMVFFVVLFSVLIQGALLSPLAKKLNLMSTEK